VKKFTIPFDEDFDEEDSVNESEESESSKSCFFQMPSKEQQDEPKLPKGKQSKRLHSVWLRRRTIGVGVQSLENTASENDASESTNSQFS
jgi:hypothetical protein